ncbi:MAG: FAD-binding protein [Rhodothermales bacterium]
MPPDLDPIIHTVKNRKWENFHRTVNQKVARLVDVWNARPNVASFPAYNATTVALQGLIGEAIAEGLRLRALGGGWSFTPVAFTEGVLVNTRPLNYQFRLADQNLHPDCGLSADHLVFAQCGVSVAELNTNLRARGKSLRTSGASNGQTIAGALSTGTHGSALGVGGMQDSVVALHLITSPDRDVWLERASAPVLGDASVQFLGAEVVRDDALFEAALVSFGSFGILHGVVLEVDDLFYLQQYRRQHPESPATWAAIEHLDFSGLQHLGRDPSVRPYFFQAVYNPYDRADGPYFTMMYREAARPADCVPRSRAGAWRPGDSAADVIARLTDVSPELSPALVNALLPQQYGDVEGVCGTWGEMFWDTSTRGRVASTAMGLPLDRVREGLDALFELNATHTVPALFAVRYVRASPAPLAFTCHPEHTAVLEIDGPHSKRMLKFYDAVWERLRDLGIPVTFHWGKLLPLDATATDGYGAARVEAWRDARHTLLPTPELRAAFTNEMLEQIGLDG